MPIGTVLELRNLCAEYGGRMVVDNITFDVKEGELLGIVGPNGAGKTTLFRAILGLKKYTGGISIFGHGPNMFRELIPLIGYVPQKITFESNFPATVHDVVAMGIISKKRAELGRRLVAERGGTSRQTYQSMRDKEEMVMAALETVGLGDLRNRRIGELSGGEQQRVFIAKSLVKDPVLLILDEPVTGIDAESQARFYEIIRRLNTDDGIAIIWSSHDLDAIKEHAGSVACMNQKLFFHGRKARFFEDENMLRAYTESSMQIHMHGHHNKEC